ncbi:phosphopantothenoylcysteine decarboxylase-like [Gigantopelta aegis]|uniref:phosphopantothenoylcysteine decarboxylase-like n=1 Tax=Gigantopelta aegis TaxID=1735272 RepID=UPI001B88CD4B|nr:phosphopantothenoylcysteine decarboxylase-like [Gigantopelta aegis]
MKILIGCTGSVATIKLPGLVNELLNTDLKPEVKVVATEKATHFFDPTSLPVPVLLDQQEWECWKKRSDPVLHIELRRWADLMVIAPLDANTLAKLSHGLCDNLLTCVVRAWDLQRPLLFAPAMNTMMWEHPLTRQHLDVLLGLGYTHIPCVEKMLVCGDSGFGAMAEVSTIVSTIMDFSSKKSSSKDGV